MKLNPNMKPDWSKLNKKLIEIEIQWRESYIENYRI
jgi:hypothetical protein